MIELHHGDFLEKAKNIPDDSVDLVLTDPPYGTVKGLRLEGHKDGALDWDEVIEPKVLFKEINRILRKNGKAVLFGQEPFTSRMITEAIPNLPFSYRMIWEKDSFAHGLSAKKAPVNYYEDVMVFSKSDSLLASHPLRRVMQKYTDKYGKDYIIELFEREGRYSSGQSARVHASYKFGFNGGVRFDLMDEKMYDFMNNYIDFLESYEELKDIDVQFKAEYASTFNIWEEEPVEPVESFEDVVVFNKRHSENNNPISLIMKEYQEKTGIFWNDDIITESLTRSGIASTKNSAKAIAKHKLDWGYRQSEFLTKKQYDLWEPIFNWEHTYEELKVIDDEYKKEVASTFNLWQKKKSKSNILKYAKDYPSLHPTMKPILLLEDLIKTFSNEGDLVVDLTMGSGSTGVAAVNTNRNFIGIELDDEYFNIAKERIETHEEKLSLL